MLGKYWVYIAALLFIASLVLHQVPLLLVSLLFFLTGGAARLWGRYCLTRIEYQHRLSANRVFFGDEVYFEVEVANRKPLPLLWIQIDDEIPAQVTLLKGETAPSHTTGRVLLSNLLSLSWYHRVKRRYPIRCLQRGCFAFGPVRIRSGDLFGFFTREMVIPQVDYLMVYPKILPLEKLGIPSKQPVGNIRLRRHLFQDPILTAGIRDYHYGDSLKRIHWRTTARSGRLQTKVFEPTTTIDMGIFLDVRTMRPPFWGSIPQLLELGVVTAASMANHAMAAGYRVGLYANQNKQFLDEPIRVPPSQHADQMMHILEVLAQIRPSETRPIASLVQYEGRNFPWGSTVVVITAWLTDTLFSTLVSLKRNGRSVALILTGGPEPSINTDGLTVYHVREDAMPGDLESLSLQEK